MVIPRDRYFYPTLTRIMDSFPPCSPLYLLYPWYEVYRGYIVFAFSVIMFVCLFVCKLFFFVKDFSATTWVRILKFGTRLGYIVFAFSVIMFVCLFVCLSVNFFFSSKISQQLLGLGF